MDAAVDAPDQLFGDEFYWPGRHLRYLDDGGDTDILQTEWSGYGMDFASSLAFLEENIYQDTVEIIHPHIERWRRTEPRPDGMLETPLRKVDGSYLYQRWLAEHYDLDIGAWARGMPFSYSRGGNSWNAGSIQDVPIDQSVLALRALRDFGLSADKVGVFGASRGAEHAFCWWP